MADVTAIIASPRKGGNCAAIVNMMVDVLTAEGKTVDVYRLNDIEGKGCQACYACKKAGKCVRKDGFTPVLESIAQSGSLILATPDYFGQACAQYRLLEDRMYGYVGMDAEGNFTANIPAGKKVAVVVTSGSGAGADNIVNGIKGVMGGFLKCDVVGEINYKEGPSGPAAENAEAMAEAEALAKKL
ncbi:MAG: flavodoxin family protein [Thermoplasmata archaeon]|nr:flavodoxin family protein [Thermoplasmata archaeon]